MPTAAPEYRVRVDSLIRESRQESFLSVRPGWNAGRPVAQTQVSGDPVPQSLATGDVTTMAVIVCIAVTTLAVSRSLRSVRFHLANMFRAPRLDSVRLRETGSETFCQLLLALDGAVACGLMALAALDRRGDGDLALTDLAGAGVLTLTVALYIVTKTAMRYASYKLFLWRQEVDYAKSEEAFHTSLTGVLTLAVALTHLYAGASPRATLAAAAASLILPKMLCLCKLRPIFLRRKGARMRIFLYFCTQEIPPLALSGGVAACFAVMTNTDFLR